MNTKNIVIIVLVLVVGILGYKLSEKPKVVKDNSLEQNTVPSESSENLKTYKNNDFGFEFQYPEVLDLNIDTDKKNFVLNPEDPNEKPFHWFEASLHDSRDRQIFNLGFSVNQPGRDFLGISLVSSADLTIGGVKVNKRIFAISEGEYKGDQTVMYQFTRNGNEYMIYATGSIEQADSIVSSLKFTN